MGEGTEGFSTRQGKGGSTNVLGTRRQESSIRRRDRSTTLRVAVAKHNCNLEVEEDVITTHLNDVVPHDGYSTIGQPNAARWSGTARSVVRRLVLSNSNDVDDCRPLSLEKRPLQNVLP
jgi:hypothetical protein